MKAPALLERAASLRFIALLFVPPSPDVAAQLEGLAEALETTQRPDARTLAHAFGTGDLEGLYHRALGPSGAVPDGECAYDDNTVGGRGQILADVSGFYLAFGYQPATSIATAADHVSSELEFLSDLAIKTAYAIEAEAYEQVEICQVAERSFVKDHLGRFVLAFLRRLAEEAQGSFYEGAAAFADAVVRRHYPEGLADPERRVKRHLPVASEDEPFDCDENMAH